jgi:hypothetical protein
MHISHTTYKDMGMLFDNQNGSLLALVTVNSQIVSVLKIRRAARLLASCCAVGVSPRASQKNKTG